MKISKTSEIFLVFEVFPMKINVSWETIWLKFDMNFIGRKKFFVKKNDWKNVCFKKFLSKRKLSLYIKVPVAKSLFVLMKVCFQKIKYICSIAIVIMTWFITTWVNKTTKILNLTDNYAQISFILLNETVTKNIKRM